MHKVLSNVKLRGTRFEIPLLLITAFKGIVATQPKCKKSHVVLRRHYGHVSPSRVARDRAALFSRDVATPGTFEIKSTALRCERASRK